MRTNHLNKYKSTIAIALLFFAGCAEEKVGPMLQDSSTFVAPSLKNAATKPSAELLPQNAANEFEKFEWERTQYGINLSTNYVLQIDNNDDFSSPQILAQTSSDNVSITVEDFNEAMLGLGVPGFTEGTVHLRVMSTINGIENEPLYSAKISRIAKTYQTSECGNFCTVGIIGDATPGGWGTDTDLRLADPTKVDKSTWTTTIYLIGGSKVKFRASDDWGDNWGGTTFASGTGTKNGPDITVPNSGYYKATFNDNTGAYTFTAVAAPVYATIGVIGNATPGGWDNDTDMTKDANDPHVWTGTYTFTTGAVKFRADNAWTTNWGSNTAPSGFGIGNGPDIPVTVGGTYFVRFNDATGEYSLMAIGNATPYTTIGIIGPAQTGGWSSDTDMVKNPANPFLWSKVITLADGDAKFRANDDWAANWGSTTFPGGVGLQNGANIPTKGGKYFVTFNSGTGEYYFLK